MRKYRVFLWVLCLEALAAGIYLSLIPGDPKNSVVLGFSLARLLNMAAFLGAAIGFGFAAVRLDWFRWLSSWLEQRTHSLLGWQRSIWFVSLLVLMSWLIPAYRIKDFDLIWERMLPSVVLGIGVLLAFLGLMLYEGHTKGYLDAEALKPDRRLSKLWLILLAVSGAVAILAVTTGFGIRPPVNRYWNTAGVPVLFEQVLYLVLAYVLIVGLKSLYFADREWRLRPWMIFAALWLITFLVWNAQPIARSYFVYQPDAPNFEYYPLSDAQRFDLGGKFMLAGQGILNGITEDKPFLMAYMAVINAAGGQEYPAMVRVQVIVLSLVVPFLYLIGKRLYSDLFGLALAVVGIIYEVNTVYASVEINSAHIKLLLSEPLTYLGVVLIVYALIRWLENPGRAAWGVLTLGLVAFFAYVRANVLLIYPAALLMIVWASWPKLKQGASRFLQANLGFFGVLVPWMAYAYAAYGYLPLLNKIDYILKTRLPEIVKIHVPASVFGKLPLFAGGLLALVRTSFWEVLYIQAAHFMNNLVKSLLIFPTSMRLEKISTVLDKTYWDETIIWDGTASPLVYLNLAVILIGILYLVAQRGVVGAVPLVVGLAYNTASSLATTSGGRYLKPSIWIFILYYLAGLYLILDHLLAAGRFSPKVFKGWPGQGLITRNGLLNWQWTAAAALMVIGLIVPAADAAIPEKYPDVVKRQVLDMIPTAVVAELGVDPGQVKTWVRTRELTVFYGDGWYPREVIVPDGLDHFGFSVVGKHPALAARFFGSWDLIQEFSNGTEVVALGCENEVEDRQFQDVILIYLPEQATVYYSGSDWQAVCPVWP